MSQGRRDIRLLAGEALFKAQGDPARPFRVYTHDAAIQAIGTQFNVYRRTEGTLVAVIEGKVNVTAGATASTLTNTGPQSSAPTPLSAGESARVSSNGKLSKQIATDLSSTTAWRQRRLVFQDAAISEMIEEFNRYNRRPQFKLEGDDVKLRHYTGMFDADDPESLIELLTAEPDLEVVRMKEEIFIRTR